MNVKLLAKRQENVARGKASSWDCVKSSCRTVILPLIITALLALPLWADGIDEILKQGIALRDSGQIDRAILKFEEVLKLKPKHAKTNFALGQSYLKKNDCEMSIKCLNNALSFGYDPLNGHLTLAEAYRICGKRLEAVMEYQLAIEIEPNSPVLHYKLGDVCLENGSSQLAEKEYSKAIEIDPICVQAIVGLANVYRKKRQFKEAESLYEKAKSTDPNYALTYYFLGAFYADQKLYDRSASEFAKYIQLESKDPKGYAALAEVRAKMRDYTNASKDMRQAIAYGDTTVGDLKFLAYLCTQNKQPYEAMEVLRWIVAKVPEDVVSWLDLAKVCSETDSFQAVASAYNRVLSLDSTQSSSIVFNLGLAYYQLEKYDSAVTMFSEKIRLDSLAAGAYINRALSYMQLKRYKPETIDDLKKTLELKPDHLQAHLWLAQVYAFLNMNKEAKTEFNTVLKLDPENMEAKEGLKELAQPVQQRLR